VSEDPMERAMDAIRDMNERHLVFQNAVVLARDLAQIGTGNAREKAWQLIDEAIERLRVP
jgi:hypothetical protein